jgi:hypothetical protein
VTTFWCENVESEKKKSQRVPSFSDKKQQKNRKNKKTKKKHTTTPLKKIHNSLFQIYLSSLVKKRARKVYFLLSLSRNKTRIKKARRENGIALE